jgi:hypothetical protein
VRLGDSWLATEVTLWEGATRVLHERYSDYTADPLLPDALFDPAAWSAAEHWTSGAARRP